MKNEDVDPLRARIDNVNKQNREELKELYKTTITNGEFTPKGGAGLGFIEMAKTHGNKLEYDFKNLSKELFPLYFQGSFQHLIAYCPISCIPGSISEHFFNEGLFAENMIN